MKRLLLSVFFYSYIIYPSYYVEASELKRILLLVLYIFIFGLLRWVIPDRIKPAKEIFYFSPFLLIPLVSSLLLHLYFWALPIPTLEDMQTYCGVPALFLAKVYSFFPRWVLIILALMSLSLLVLYLLGKGKKVWIVFFIFGILLAIFTIHFLYLESFGSLKHIFRHPPIPKTIYFLGYLFFGIEEWVGSFIQFIFLSAAGVFVGQILSLLTKENKKFSFICGFTITLFFPTFFHWTNFCSLVAGELFFISVSFYYFLRYIKEKEEAFFFYCMGILGIGLLYERRILFCCLFFPIILALNRKFSFSLAKYLTIPLILGLPFIIVSYPYRDASLAFPWIKEPLLLLISAKHIFWALGPILTIFTLYSFLLSIKNRETHIFCLFFLLYYLFISSTGAVGVLRHMQPSYLALVIILSFFVAKRRTFLRVPLLVCLNILMLYHSLFSPHPLLLTLSNLKEKNWGDRGFGILPYRDCMRWIKENLYDTKIYAPMGCEPVHFYFAKLGMKEELWIRTPSLKGFTISSLYNFCLENKIEYLLLPQGDRRHLEPVVDCKLIDLICAGVDEFILKKSFSFGENKLLLFRVKKMG